MGACSSAAKIGGRWALMWATRRLPRNIYAITLPDYYFLGTIASCSYNSVQANPSTQVAQSSSLQLRSCCHVAWSLAEASHGVCSLKRRGLITCQVTGRRWRSPLEQGGLEVPCELAFSGTEQLMKNVCVHVRTTTLGGRLSGCQHVLEGRKQRGGRLRGYPPKSLGTPKLGGGRLCEHGCLPGRIRYKLMLHIISLLPSWVHVLYRYYKTLFSILAYVYSTTK